MDLPGGRVVLVSGTAGGEYTMQVTVAQAPMTSNNDALRGVDAPGTCADALLVGPGVQLGTLELGDTSDVYRFQLDEGQIGIVALRPGDTAEAADMDLYFYDPTCKLILQAPEVGVGLIKGSVGLITYNVPPGQSGLYRAEVRHKNGIGTYELAVATDVVSL